MLDQGLMGAVSLDEKLTSISKEIQKIWKPLALVLGSGLIIHAVIRLVKGIAQEHGQTSWVGIIIEFAVGGLLLVNGLDTFKDVAEGMGDVIK